MANKFATTKIAERRFGIELRKVARVIGAMVNAHIDGPTIRDQAKLAQALKNYSEALGPWASKVVSNLLKDVSRANKRAWESQSAKIGSKMQSMMSESATGAVVQMIHNRQVELIKSLPLEAGLRAQKLAQEAAIGGRRADEVAAELLRTEQVTSSRATLIARTEIAKANAAITQARAQYVGATHYIWRTAEDGDVRESHAQMEGTVHRFDQPPTLDDGMTGNPGEIWNCFTGDTEIKLDNDLKKVFRSWYSGIVVDINVNGVVFTATPNHPILTSSGWKAAGELQAGDNLVNNLIPSVAEDDVHQSKATFEQVFLSGLGPMEAIAGAEFNFYGDIPAGDVDCVLIDNDLLAEMQSSCAKGVKNFTLPLSDAISGDAPIGTIAQVSNSGLSGCIGNGLQFSGAGIAKSDDIGFAAVPDVDTIVQEDSPDRASGDIQSFGNGQLAFPGSIASQDILLRKADLVDTFGRPSPDRCNSPFADMQTENVGIASNNGGGIFEKSAIVDKLSRVDDIVFRNFSGHVYTAETIKGWYSVTSADIVVKNCRCFSEPIIPGAE